MKEEDYIIELKDISKSFSGVLVLDRVTVKLKNHTVHAIVGGNGAGKSTLMKILDGFHTPDSGKIVIDNEEYVFKSTSHAHSKGIYLIPQEPRLFPHMSVLENIGMGYRGNKKDLIKKVKDLMVELNCNFKLTEEAEFLPIANQQLVEIIKGLVQEARVLIFDEPTSALSFQETEELFKAIKRILQQPQIGIFYITHRLRELESIADEVTVLNDGKVVTFGPMSDFTVDLMVKYMVPDVKKGEVLAENVGTKSVENQKEEVFPKKKKTLSRKVLVVDDLTGDRFRNVSFSLKEGEILGIAGVIGAGRTELAETIFGIRKRLGGKIFLDNEEFNPRRPRDSIKKGLMYIPEDRHLNGIFPKASVVNNVSSSVLFELAPVFLNKRKERAIAEDSVNKLRIKVNTLEDPLSSLSGGNQQKIVVSKTLAVKPRVIIMDEPTRGIDSGSRKDLYQLINALAERSVAIIVISSDLDEIIELCDRVIVMHQGEIFDVIEGSDLNFDRVIMSSFGVRNE